MAWFMLGIGLVLVIEGLAFVFLPGRLDELLAAIAQIGREQRRLIGLIAVALGVLLVWGARQMGM